MQRYKWLLLAASIILLCVCSDAIYIIFRMKSQGIPSLNASIEYLSGFERWKHLTVGAYLACLCSLKIELGMLVCGAIAKISAKAENATTVLLLSGSLAATVYLLLCLFF